MPTCTTVLIEAKFVPSASSPTTYATYDFYWLNLPVALLAVDQSGTTAHYFLHADEFNRSLEMFDWPSTCDASDVGSLNPELLGWDQIVNGESYYQPQRLDGTLYDDGTWSSYPSSVTDRPALDFERAAFYDPMTETF